MTTAFRFDAIEHVYFLEDRAVPSITQMIELCGLVETDWFTEESRRRGTEVHDLTAAYDLQALDPTQCRSNYHGWLLAHVAAMKIVRPTWTHVEEPFVCGKLKFGGRPDRLGLVYRLRSTVEVKSGAIEKCHQIQTALQAILAAAEAGFDLPAEHWNRLALYLQHNGRFRLEQHTDRRDFDEAYRVIKRCTA